MEWCCWAPGESHILTSSCPISRFCFLHLSQITPRVSSAPTAFTCDLGCDCFPLPGLPVSSLALPRHSLPWRRESGHVPCCCCCSVTKFCPTLCNPIKCSTPGFPVLHCLPEFAQTHIHWVSGAIQPSHPLLPPSPPALNLPASGYFPMSWLFASRDQRIGASASVLPMNTQDWSP